MERGWCWSMMWTSRSSVRSAAKRSALSEPESTNGSRPRYRSRTTSPIAGPIRKPWPEKPVA